MRSGSHLAVSFARWIASTDATLRRRILRVVRRVPLPYPGFWLAALAGLGEEVDWSAGLPRDDGMG